MDGSVIVRSLRQSLYSGRPGARLWRHFAAVAAVLTFGVHAGGCSFSYQLGSLFGKDEDKSDVTGSIGATNTANSNVGSAPPDADMAFARAAAAEVLSRGGKDTSVAWTNPSTGARGTVTPIATSYTTQDGVTCRDFLASYVRQKSESWMQGEACRMAKGSWEVKSLKPWKRS